MAEESGASSNGHAADPAPTQAVSIWQRLNNHKVLQWGLAYLGGALALAQAQDLLSATFDWPGFVGRVFLIVLIAGLPIALTLAWYHGHRALRHVTAGELSILSVLVLIGGLFFTLAFGPSDTALLDQVSAAAAPTTAPQPGAASSEVLPNKIAVLPCENLSPDPKDAHFATGLHQDIIWQLDKIRNLNPIPRRIVLPYADTRLTLVEIASELGVQALLDCTVRYANGRVRIAAELLDASGARTLWRNDYEPSINDLDDVFGVQADIAMNIANAMSVVFTPEEYALLAKPPTGSTDAYVLVLRAQQAPDFTRAESLLRQAIAADDNYALPYAWLASLWSLTVINTNVATAIPPAEQAELRARVREYAERALELDPLVPYARAALTMDATLSWRWSEAYDRYAKTRDATPNDVMQYDIFLLSYLGRFNEATAVAARGAELSPSVGTGAMYKGWASIYQGRYDDAAREFTTVVNNNPGFLLARDFLARAQVARGEAAAALDQLRIADRIAVSERQLTFFPTLAYSFGRLGQTSDAMRLFDQMLVEEAAGTRFGAGGWAMAHLAVGDEARALEQLRIAARKAREHQPDEGFFMLMELRMNITNDDVLRRPEFAQVLASIKGD